MKAGDIVKLIDSPTVGWMDIYRERLFEVKEVYERRCMVRMLNVVNPERYWFVEKNNFEVVNENR